KERQANKEAQRIYTCGVYHVYFHDKAYESNHQRALHDGHKEGRSNTRHNGSENRPRANDLAQVDRRAHQEVSHCSNPQGKTHEVWGKAPTIAGNFVYTLFIKLHRV